MDAGEWQEAIKELAANVHGQLGAWFRREDLRSEDPADDTVAGIERYTRVVYQRGVLERERLRLALKELEGRHACLRADAELDRNTVDADLMTMAVELGTPPPRWLDW